VRQTTARPLEPMKEMPGLEEWRIERFPVEGDEGSGKGELRADHLQKLTFIGMAQQHELTCEEPAVIVEHAASHEKGVGAGAAGEASRLQIEEGKRRTCLGTSHQERRVPSGFGQTPGYRAHRVAAVRGPRRVAPFDDEARQPISPAPAAAENRSGIFRAGPKGASVIIGVIIGIVGIGIIGIIAIIGVIIWGGGITRQAGSSRARAFHDRAQPFGER
jgi:hypothetical protein